MKRLSPILLLLVPLLLPCDRSPAQDKKDPVQPVLHGKGYVPLTPQQRAAFYKQSRKEHGGRILMMSQNQELPPAFDCRTKGWVLPVGDQGQCGSCYLYSTAYGTMTQAFVKAGYGKPDGSFVMSVQYGMDCHNFGGCNGGNGTEVIDWACKNGWYAEKWVDTDGKTHNDYPSYEARSRGCRKVDGAKVWKPASWGFVSSSQNRPATTLEIKTALVNFGPLNVSLDAGGQFGNGAGTITSLGRNIDHEIELVGYDDSDGTFLLKNQWTTQWGNGGYRKVTYAAAQNLVDVFFVTAAELPVPPPPPPDPPGPVPPGPLPPGDNNIVITIGGVTQKYLLVDPSQRQADLEAIQAILDRMKQQITPVPPPPAKKETVEPPKIEKVPEPKKTAADYPAWTGGEHGPCVVFVGVEPRDIQGAKVFYQETFPGVAGSVIIVSKDGVSRKDLRADASDSSILYYLAI